MNLTPYHAKYLVFELTKLYSSNSFEKFASSLSDAQVDLNPHKVATALLAFQLPLSKVAILADEVGFRKTIEAGIVVSQKWTKRKLKILIVAQANLQKQWSREIADKFFLPSVIIETKSFDAAFFHYQANRRRFRHWFIFKLRHCGERACGEYKC